MNAIIVRSVRYADLEALSALEVRVWKRHETPILSHSDLATWYAEESPYFLVAEGPKGICGYYFGRQVAFAPERMHEFLDPAHVTGLGMSDHLHDPSQDSVYGISVVSEISGAGALLNDAVHQLLEVMGIRYFVGFTRLSRLGAYVSRLMAQHGALPYKEEEIALWYAHQSAHLLQMPHWTMAQPCPTLTLIPLRRPDPVLAFHVRGTNFGLLAILANYMPDPASLNYGALIASAYPHR
jgi:hypothetical protein